jgi:hypothetical protein
MSRYTFQWIVTPDKFTLARIPNNNDATFMDHQLPKPADLLLHYNYGAAAVKQWGRNSTILANRPDLPRPSVPAPAPMGPQKVKHDRSIAIEKRKKRRREEGSDGMGPSPGILETKCQLAVQNEGNTRAEIWDEDDVMLFFWGNSKVARERYVREEEERRKLFEKWRSGVLGNPLNV